MRWSSLQQNPSLIQRRWRLCRLKSKRIAPRIKWSNINLERIQICILVIAIIRFVCDCVFVVYSLIIVLYSKPHICFVQIDDYTFNALKQLFFCSISIIHTLFISITISDAILLYSSTKSTFIIFFCDYFDIPRKIFKRIIKKFVDSLFLYSACWSKWALCHHYHKPLSWRLSKRTFLKMFLYNSFFKFQFQSY